MKVNGLGLNYIEVSQQQAHALGNMFNIFPESHCGKVFIFKNNGETRRALELLNSKSNKKNKTKEVR